MDHEIELKDSALTEAEKITFIEKVYNAKVAETKLIKKGKYYYIKGWEGNQLPATIDFYYINAMKLEFNPGMATRHSESPWI